jgi:hypothetical protein
MPTAYSINAEHAQAAMEGLLRLQDVRHVAVIDAIGLCLAHVGTEPVSKTLLNDWTVVARSAFAAADQLGQRSGAGQCISSTYEHTEGGTLLRRVAGGMLLIIQHGPRTAVATLMQQAAEVAQALPTAVELRPHTPLSRQSPPAVPPDVLPPPNHAPRHAVRPAAEVVEAELL